LVLRCGAASIGAPGAATSANRIGAADVADRSGKGKFTLDFQVKNFDGRAKGTFRRQNCRDEQPHDVLSISSAFSSGKDQTPVSKLSSGGVRVETAGLTASSMSIVKRCGFSLRRR